MSIHTKSMTRPSMPIVASFLQHGTCLSYRWRIVTIGPYKRNAVFIFWGRQARYLFMHPNHWHDDSRHVDERNHEGIDGSLRARIPMHHAHGGKHGDGAID